MPPQMRKKPWLRETAFSRLLSAISLIYSREKAES